MKTALTAAVLITAGLSIAGCEGGTLTRTVEQDGITLRTVTTGPESARVGEVALLGSNAEMQPSGMIGSRSGGGIGDGSAVVVAQATGVRRLLGGFSGPQTIRVCAEAQEATVQPSVQLNGRTYIVERQCPQGE